MLRPLKPHHCSDGKHMLSKGVGHAYSDKEGWAYSMGSDDRQICSHRVSPPLPSRAENDTFVRDLRNGHEHTRIPLNASNLALRASWKGHPPTAPPEDCSSRFLRSPLSANYCSNREILSPPKKKKKESRRLWQDWTCIAFTTAGCSLS